MEHFFLGAFLGIIVFGIQNRMLKKEKDMYKENYEHFKKLYFDLLDKCIEDKSDKTELKD